MKRPITLMKFGGTSMGDAACIKRAAEIVAASTKESAVVVVVSAMGGVTNRLGAAAQSSVEGDRHAAENVGDRLRGMPGIAGRTFSALGKRGVNIIAIAQGSSEYNVSFVVQSDSMAEAVQELHKEFGLMRSDYSEV